MLAAIGAALVLLVRHFRRHPRHAAAVGLVVLVATGHPVIAAIGVGAWVYVELRRLQQRLRLSAGGTGAQSQSTIRPPQVPRLPRAPQAPRPPQIRGWQ